MTNGFSREGTIVALASAAGRAGVALVRLSGPEAGRALDALCLPAPRPAPREAALRSLRDPRSGDLLDKALVLWFPSPASFTGEDVVELHLHGSRAIVAGVLSALCAMEGVRLAEAGAFTRRAFENGKLDLTEAEGLADLIEAETAAQRRQALRQMDGALGRLYEAWTQRLKKALALIEADIDFSDDDLPEDLLAGYRDSLRALEREIAAHLDDNHRGERLREGFVVALLGAPNVGKSSLLNALARREAAIVDATPGTTRDVIEIHMDLGGYPVTLIDTAGLRETEDAVEKEGIRRAKARAQDADLKILLFDGEKGTLREATTESFRDERALLVVNKSDKAEKADGDPAFLRISALTGEGLDLLTAKIVCEIERRFGASSSPALTRTRHREALEECRGHLARSLAAPAVELCAEDLRLAARALGRITGRVDVEDVLDLIFSQFCIGK